jgi:putative ABC transport system ATP-binding protein
LENVQLPMTLSGKVGKKSRQHAVELLEQVGLSDRMEHHLEELSGGEQQRIAVAIALSNQPRLLLADEPTGELDTATAQTIYDLFRDLNRKLGLTIVIVSHDPGIARQVDRVVAIRDGKLASESVRVRADAVAGTDGWQEEHLHTFEEMVILDSAGRLPVPREYLDHFDIRRRVRLEIVEEGILIRPPKSGQSDSESGELLMETPEIPSGVHDLQSKPAWLDRTKGLLKRFNSALRSFRPLRKKRADEKNSEGKL